MNKYTSNKFPNPGQDVNIEINANLEPEGNVNKPVALDLPILPTDTESEVNVETYTIDSVGNQGINVRSITDEISTSLLADTTVQFTLGSQG